jgi:hypothetical protein
MGHQQKVKNVFGRRVSGPGSESAARLAKLAVAIMRRTGDRTERNGRAKQTRMTKRRAGRRERANVCVNSLEALEGLLEDAADAFLVYACREFVAHAV